MTTIPRTLAPRRNVKSVVQGSLPEETKESPALPAEVDPQKKKRKTALSIAVLRALGG